MIILIFLIYLQNVTPLHILYHFLFSQKIKGQMMVNNNRYPDGKVKLHERSHIPNALEHFRGGNGGGLGGVKTSMISILNPSYHLTGMSL